MKKNRIKLILITLISFSTTAYCNLNKLESPYLEYEELLNSEPDKVLELLKSESNLTPLKLAQNQLLLSLTYYVLVYPDKSLESSQQALKLVDSSVEPWLYHSIKLAESMAMDISGTANLGIPAAKEALQWSQLNKHKDLEISALITLGHLNITSTQYIAALDYLQKAYDLASLETHIRKGRIAGVIAVLYEERKENQLSIPYFIESAEYHRSNNNLIELSIALYGLGRAKATIGNIDEGKKLLQESIDLSTKVNDLQGVAYAQKELAGIAIKEQKYDQALQLLNLALPTFEVANNKFMLFDVHKILTSLALKTKQLDTAKFHQQQASLFINEINQPIQNLALEKLDAAILAAEGDFQQAYQQLYETMLKESNFKTIQSTQLLHLLRSEFELDSKEKENQILAARNELQNIKLITETQKNEVLQLLFLAALIILTLLAILIYRTRKHKLRFQYLANHDGLTGLYNRNYILEKLKAVFHESSGMKHKLNIAMIDLDHFKSINDTYGHHIGDKVLKQLALIFKSCLTENDCCGRFGGEEFLLVLPHKSLEKAIEQLNQIRIKTLEISQVLKLDNKSTSLSVGVCHVNHDSSRTSIDEWIKCSDDALYQAKSKGRNTIVVGI